MTHSASFSAALFIKRSIDLVGSALLLLLAFLGELPQLFVSPPVAFAGRRVAFLYRNDLFRFLEEAHG